MKNFFEAIARLFEELLLVPYNILADIELQNWWVANFMSWLFMAIGLAAGVYWILQLRSFDKNEEEDKDTSAHSFL